MPDEEGLMVARGELVYVVLNLYPYNPGHSMVVPYRRVSELEDLTAEESAELMAFTQKLIPIGPDKPFEAVSYLPLCHVAERCYGEVMQLVLGGTVSFAESIDTVALNIREIAPTFFVGVPRIYEKLQQGFLFRLGESGPLRQRFTKACFPWGRNLSDRRQEGTETWFDRIAYALLYVPQHPASSRLCAQPAPAVRRRLDLAGDPSLLRHRRPTGLAGLRADRKRGCRLHPDRQPSPPRRLRPSAGPHRMETG